MADVLAVRNDYRAQSWVLLLQECSESGLTNREFCRQRGISEKSFYYWLHKLRNQLAEAAAPQLVPPGAISGFGCGGDASDQIPRSGAQATCKH